MIEFIVALFIVAVIGVFCMISYDLGKLRERRETIERWRTAIDIFFDARKEYSVPDWESSSALIAYVGGMSVEEPPEVTYVPILDRQGDEC